MKLMLFSLLFLSSSLVQAQDRIGQPAGVPVCNDTAKTCEYVAINVPAQEIIDNVNASILGGEGACPSPVMHLCRKGASSILFGHTDSVKYEKMKAAIPAFDRLDILSKSPLVELAVDVYMVSESSLRRIRTALTEVHTGINNGATTKDVTTSAEGLSLGLNFGSIKFNAALAVERGRDEVEFVTSIVRYVPNYQDISYSNIREVKKPVGQTDTQTVDAGLRLSGKTVITGGDVPLIYIKDYYLSYGIPDPSTPEDDISSLSVSQSRLELYPNVAIGLTSETKTAVSRGRSFGLLHFRRSSGDSKYQLLTIVRARYLTFDEFVAENRSVLKSNDSLNPMFTEDEVLSMPAGENLDAIINSLQPFAVPTRNGDAIIGFRMDSRLATRQTYDRQIEVSVKSSKGYKDKHKRSVQNMMVGEYRFQDIPSELLTQSAVRFQVTLKDVRTGKRKNVVLSFNPETYEIYKEE